MDLKSVQGLRNLQDLKKSLALEDRLTEKMTETFKNSITIVNEMLLKIVIQKTLPNHLCVSKTYPVTQNQALKNQYLKDRCAISFRKLKFQNIEIHFYSIEMLKIFPLLPSNKFIIYYQTPYEVTWQLRQKIIKYKCSKKSKRKVLSKNF